MGSRRKQEESQAQGEIFLTKVNYIKILDKFLSRCSIVNVDFLNNMVTEEETHQHFPITVSHCSVLGVYLQPEILDTELINLLTEGTYIDTILITFPSKKEQKVIAATLTCPAGFYARFASFVAGNLEEQPWIFSCPAAISLLHSSLLPVAIMEFCTKLAVIAGRAIERLSRLVAGVAMECDLVVLIIGMNQPIVVGQTNAILSRIDLLCEIVGATLFIQMEELEKKSENTEEQLKYLNVEERRIGDSDILDHVVLPRKLEKMQTEIKENCRMLLLTIEKAYGTKVIGEISDSSATNLNSLVQSEPIIGCTTLVVMLMPVFAWLIAWVLLQLFTFGKNFIFTAIRFR